MQSTIREGHSPAVVVALAAGETIASEAGTMMFVSGDVDMDVQMPRRRPREQPHEGVLRRRGAVPRRAPGPGHVTLQTLPFSRTARRVLEAAGGGQGESGTSGGVLGRLLSD